MRFIATLAELDDAVKAHSGLLGVGFDGALPERARTRRAALKRLRNHRDEVAKWAARDADQKRQKKLQGAAKTHTEIDSLCHRLREMFGQLGLDVKAEPKELIASWPTASVVIELALRDAKNLATQVPSVGGLGDELAPTPEPLIEVEIGRKLRDGLQDLKSLQLVLASQLADAEQIDPLEIDEEHVSLLREFAAMGMVAFESDRPEMDPQLVRDLAEAGIDIVTTP